MKCFYAEYCRNYRTGKCSESCQYHSKMKYLMGTALIPENRQRIQTLNVPPVDADTYSKLARISSKIDQYVENGYNFLLHSPKTGNGKTSWAIKLMMSYFNKIWADTDYIPRGYFIYVPDFLNRLKRAIKEKDDELLTLQKNLLEVDFVALDDIASNELSEYDVSVLSQIIDQRILRGKTTLFTTNVGKEKMRQILGERLVDRIWSGSIVLEFKSESNRGLL